MANDINKEDPHYKGEYGSIYEVNRKFPTGGVAGDFVVIDGWAHYWNADRGTWCVNAERDSYWDELITSIIEKFKLVRGATYMGLASLGTVPEKVIGAKLYYFATEAGTYKNFGDLDVPQGINVLYSENGSSWVNTTLLEVAQELGVSTKKVVSQKALNDALNLKANQSSMNEALAKKADNKRVDDELAKKFDKDNISQEFGDSEDKVVSQFALPFREIESPEFIKAIVDAEDHFLFGIQLDGSIEWGKGIPAPIRAKLQEIINQCQQDKTDILEAINAAKKELSASITALQEGKVDKEEGKSLIEDEVKECFRVIENEEFIMAVVDSEDRALFGIYRDSGKPYFPLNEMYHVEQNEEFFALWQDSANHVLLGIRRDGQIIGEIHAVNALKQVISQLQSDVASLQEKVGTIDSNLKELLDVFSLQENEEYLAVEQDAEGKILSSTNPDGSHYINNVRSETIPEEFSHIEDPEGRMEITKDAKDKIIDYRDSEGFMHFVKVFVRELRIGKELCIKDTNDLYDIFKVFLHENKSALNYKFELPVHGDVDILKETFYLTSNSGYTDKEGILPMMVHENTEENAEKGITVSKFYVKSTLTDNNDGTYAINSSSVALDFYVPKDILEKDGKTYVKSTLQKNEDDYTVTDESVEVTKITMPPVLETWKVDKKTEHQCEVKISFGNYLSGVFNVGIKFQGSSTLYRLKRNLRFTFYNSAFSKKEKKKIGELPESNGYNLKAYYADYSRIKEPVIFRLYREARLLHSFNEQAPWNSEQHFYTGNTGCYINFPVTVKIDGNSIT